MITLKTVLLKERENLVFGRMFSLFATFTVLFWIPLLSADDGLASKVVDYQVISRETHDIVRLMPKEGWKIRGPEVATQRPSIPQPGSLSLVHLFDPKTEEKVDMAVEWPPTKSFELYGEIVRGYADSVDLRVHNGAHHPLPAGTKIHVQGTACSATECRPFQDILTFSRDYGTQQGSTKVQQKSIIMLLFFAFLGGLILNLMPCVFPVLALKVAGFAKKERVGRHRMSLLMTSLGILLSFWCLAGLALVMRAGGTSLGWGIHFQNPWFLGGMVCITMVMALNLMGAFEWMLPVSLLRRLDKSFAKPRAAAWSDLFSGLLATLLATPCTAPFLSLALGFALAQHPWMIVLFFSVAGLGFALPYLVLLMLPAAWIPRPKPGRWMLRLRHFLGWCVLGTSLWLAGLFFISVSTNSIDHASQISDVSKTLAEIPDSIRRGQTVVVVVSASWCVTCHVNEQRVLRPLAAWLNDHKVTLLRLDWTHPRSEIAAFVRNHHRAGIPLTVAYGPAFPQGLVLPDLLTEAAVKDTILKVSSPSQDG